MSVTIGDKIYYGIKPLYYISKLFGLAPFSINSNKIIIKFMDYFIFGFWIIFNISGFYIFLPQVIYELMFDRFDKLLLLWFFNCTMMFSKGIIFLIFNRPIISRRKFLPKILISLLNLDSEHFQNSIFRTKQRKLFILLCLIFSSMTTDYCLKSLYPTDLTRLGNVQEFYLYVNRLNSSIIILQFIISVTILKEICKHVNQLLVANLITKHRYNRISSFSLWYNCKTETMNNYCLINRNYSNFQHLRDIYIKIWDIFNSINIYYQIYLLLEVLTNFSDSVLVIYYAMNVLKRTENLYCNILSCYVSFCFFWMAKLCSDIEEQVKLSVIIVQKFMLVSNIEHSTLTELERFSFQLNNIKMEFNICGIFTMNLRFLSSFLGVALTYLVILHQ
ncbi:hypothetical protein L9F63_027489, partial [Diploptera punctata]